MLGYSSLVLKIIDSYSCPVPLFFFHSNVSLSSGSVMDQKRASPTIDASMSNCPSNAVSFDHLPTWGPTVVSHPSDEAKKRILFFLGSKRKSLYFVLSTGTGREDCRAGGLRDFATDLERTAPNATALSAPRWSRNPSDW